MYGSNFVHKKIKNIKMKAHRDIDAQVETNL
jgi:hypothetical protein